MIWILQVFFTRSRITIAQHFIMLHFLVRALKVPARSRPRYAKHGAGMRSSFGSGAILWISISFTRNLHLMQLDLILFACLDPFMMHRY